MQMASQYLTEISKGFCHVEDTFSEMMLIFASIVAVVLYNCTPLLNHFLCGKSNLVNKSIAINKQKGLHSG